MPRKSSRAGRVLVGALCSGLLFLCAALFALASGTVYPPRTNLPDFGVMFGDDGSQFLNKWVWIEATNIVASTTNVAQREAALKELLTDTVDHLHTNGVKTLVMAFTLGSDLSYAPRGTNIADASYPNTFASEVGWQLGPTNSSGARTNWGPAGQIRCARLYIDHNIDPVQVIGERAKSHDMKFVISYRMNDEHYARSPYSGNSSYNTGEFWWTNQEKALVPGVPVSTNPLTWPSGPPPVTNAWPSTGDARLNFTYTNVRAYRAGIIAEAVERYRNVADGIELDFTHSPFFFPQRPALGSTNSEIITEMVESVRSQLSGLGTNRFLLVKVPTVGTAEMWGLNIEDWITRRVVDVVVPGHATTYAGDMPIYDSTNGLAVESPKYISLAASHGVRVMPMIYSWTGAWSWPFPRDPRNMSHGTSNNLQWVREELVRGASASYRAMGTTNGFEMFNFFLPLTQDASLQQLTNEDCRTWYTDTVAKSGDSVVNPTTFGKVKDPAGDHGKRIWSALTDPTTTNNRVYEVTPANGSDNYAHVAVYQKQLPRILYNLQNSNYTSNAEAKFTLYVGEDINISTNVMAPYCALRLGFNMPARLSSGATNTNNPTKDWYKVDSRLDVIRSGILVVKVNGTNNAARVVERNLSLDPGHLWQVTSPALGSTNAFTTNTVFTTPAVTRAYLYVPLSVAGRALFRKGENTILVTYSESGAAGQPLYDVGLGLVEMQLGVFHDPSVP